MHLATIRLICNREQRDLWRDRRTVFMIFILPVALYPLSGVIAFTFALHTIDQEITVGVAGHERLPAANASLGLHPLAAACFSAAGGPASGIGAAAWAETFRTRLVPPPLIHEGQFLYIDSAEPSNPLIFKALPDADRTRLDRGEIDVLVVIPATFQAELDPDRNSALEVYYREGDERSRLGERRVTTILNRWKRQLKVTRFVRHGLPADFDEPITVRRPQEEEAPYQRLTMELTEMIARFFPFLLIMWVLAGALHPAIDLTAGEKERGTLETLLLSPASRGEIVTGKFGAVWVFSAATALWNLAWLGGAAWLIGFFVPEIQIMRLAGLFWCSVVTVLLAALFSAVSMALGAYARSTKEGQYFLLPLFIVTMPLTFLPLVPGVELNWFYSLVPITGATLLLQKLLNPRLDPGVWLYFAAVIGSLLLCSALALRWAAAQFRREEVLFRESEGLDWRSWFGLVRRQRQE
jgi:sodium transport system permease protein